METRHFNLLIKPFKSSSRSITLYSELESVLKTGRESMTKAALQRFDLRVKRMNFSFFNHLGSLSERTSNVRKSLDGSRPLTHGERQMEEGMGTAMCRTSNRNKNSDLLKNYQEKMQVWLGKRLSMHSNAAFLCNDDFFKYFPKNSFRMIKDESKEGPKSLEGKDNDQHVFAVGVVKVLRDVPLVIQEAAMPPVKEPAYINPPAVVDFLVKALLDGSDSVKSTVQKIIDGDYFQHLPAEEQAFMKANIGSLYDESNHYLRIEYVSYRMNKLVTEDRNGKRMALNHILKNRFKTFKEFLQSLIQFMLNKEIYRQACLGVLFLILGDYPCWDRMVVLLLQGERKGRRTLQHLADLIAASATDEQRVALLEMFDIPEPETHLYVGEPRMLSDLYYILAGKMESCLVPFSGRFHLFALNNSTDHVKFHEPIFTALYAFVKDTDVAKVPKVTSMKARKQICLLDALNGSWLLIRHKYEPIFADMKYASNKALACLRYLLEYAGSLSTVLYNLTFKSGKCNEKVYEHMSMLCFDIFRSQRKNYRQLVIELESQYLYWKKVNHPMLNIVKSSHNIIDEICIEGSAEQLVVEQPMAVASMPVQVQLPVDPVVPMAVDIYVSLQPTPELVTGDGVDVHFSAHGSKRKTTAGSGTENFAAAVQETPREMHLQKERELAKRNRDLKRKAKDRLVNNS